MATSDPLKATKCWIKSIVVDLNLCPFAQRVLSKNEVRFTVSNARSEEQLLADLQKELYVLDNDKAIETSLLIHPHVLNDFHQFNQFLNYVDQLIEVMELEGIFQIASFHPNYQFSGTEPDDAENYSNRSPFPMLHLLREDSVSEAITHYPDSELIPKRNIDHLKSLGREKMRVLLRACLDDQENQ